VLNRVAAFVGRHAHCSGRAPVEILRRKHQSAMHRVIMVAQHAVLMCYLDPANTRAPEDFRRRFTTADSGQHHALAIAGVSRFHPRRRPERQRHRSNKQDPDHNLPFVIILPPPVGAPPQPRTGRFDALTIIPVTALNQFFVSEWTVGLIRILSADDERVELLLAASLLRRLLVPTDCPGSLSIAPTLRDSAAAQAPPPSVRQTNGSRNMTVPWLPAKV
jgi:hypothetical protein